MRNSCYTILSIIRERTDDKSKLSISFKFKTDAWMPHPKNRKMRIAKFVKYVMLTVISLLGLLFNIEKLY